MTEAFLHFVWRYWLFNQDSLTTTNGQAIRIIKTGTHNADAGPDFFNARIQVGDTQWAGNVEVHIKTSDWRKHGHERDKAYESVILHVVFSHDTTDVTAPQGNIPVLELQTRIPPALWKNYQCLQQSKDWIPCEKQLNKVNPEKIKISLDRMGVERLEQKVKTIAPEFLKSKNHIEETCYILLARSFGLGINALPFELTAKALPLTVLLKHRDSALQCEALMLGQAGLLGQNFNDAYPSLLKKEYLFLQKKYSLQPIDGHLWKFLRLRPANFPTIRLSQLAKLLCSQPGLLSAIAEAEVEQIAAFFDVQASDYWSSHYVFDKPSSFRIKKTGTQLIHATLINAIAPLLFLLGDKTGKEPLKEKALALLEHIPAEKNTLVLRWKNAGVHASSSLHSQGLIQLKNEYCDFKKCLNCNIGNHLLSIPH